MRNNGGQGSGAKSNNKNEIMRNNGGQGSGASDCICVEASPNLPMCLKGCWDMVHPAVCEQLEPDADVGTATPEAAHDAATATPEATPLLPEATLSPSLGNAFPEVASLPVVSEDSAGLKPAADTPQDEKGALAAVLGVSRLDFEQWWRFVFRKKWWHLRTSDQQNTEAGPVGSANTGNRVNMDRDMRADGVGRTELHTSDPLLRGGHLTPKALQLESLISLMARQSQKFSPRPFFSKWRKIWI